MTQTALPEDKAQTLLLSRLEDLIQGANYLISTQRGTSGVVGAPRVSGQDYQRWRTSSLNFINTSCGPNSVYRDSFIESVKNKPYTHNVKAGNGILLAMKDDIINGYFTTVARDMATSIVSAATIESASVNLQLSSAVYSHIAQYLEKEDYFHAVEESYKVVREKLREVTGKEKASDIFNPNAESNKHHEAIFGKTADIGTPESDFYRGVGYLNLAIQFLRNEKSHTLATTLDKNLAIHYISLASLAYDLILRGDKK